MTGSGGGHVNAIVIEDEDDDFISLVAAAEAKALLGGGGNKRLKTGSSPEKEGSYLAALRGSKSSQCQQSQQKIQNPGDRAARARVSSGGGLGGCYKCGEPGHWARDCGVGGEGGGSVVPDKECRCGVGVCLVWTSNTAKNPGRKFYRCPLKEENGSCGFFEWCDYQPVGTPFIDQALPGSVVPFIPEMQCPCNFGTCLVLTAKTGKNAGQQYYRCSNQGQHSIVNNASSEYISGRSSSGCFKCGQNGHWSRDCTMSSSASYADGGETISFSSRTCFKCGKAGHWARDCLGQAQASTSERRFSGSSNSAFTHNNK